MVKRDRHEITVEILKRAKSRKLKTEIMREVGLSYSQAKQYLDMLLKRGALEIDENNRYRTTEEGTKFLERCESCLLINWNEQRRRA